MHRKFQEIFTSTNVFKYPICKLFISLNIKVLILIWLTISPLSSQNNLNGTNKQVSVDETGSTNNNNLSSRFKKNEEINIEDEIINHIPLLVDVPSLTGKLLFLGNDGAVKTFSNPAYLAFPISSKSLISISATSSYGHYTKLEQSIIIDDKPSSGYGQWNGNIGIGIHNLFKDWSFGLSVAGPENYIYNNLKLNNGGIDPNAVSGFTLDFSQSKLNEFRDITLRQLLASLGASWKIDEKQAIGLSFGFMEAKKEFFVDLDMFIISPFSALFEIRETSQVTYKEIKTNFSYVYYTGNGSLTVGVMPFSMRLADTSQKTAQTISVASTVISTASETQNFSSETLNQPQVSFGASQLLLGKVKVYAELINYIPITNKFDNFEMFDPTNGGQKFSNELSQNWNIRFATGFAINIWRGLNVHLGAYIRQKNSQSTAQEYEEYYTKFGATNPSKIIKDMKEETWGASGGFSYAINKKLAFYFGSGYEQHYFKENKSIYDSFKPETKIEVTTFLTQLFNINLGVQWYL